MPSGLLTLVERVFQIISSSFFTQEGESSLIKVVCKDRRRCGVIYLNVSSGGNSGDPDLYAG